MTKVPRILDGSWSGLSYPETQEGKVLLSYQWRQKSKGRGSMFFLSTGPLVNAALHHEEEETRMAGALRLSLERKG